MATEQVLSWIQNELKLSQVVSNFETDFSNGYLLGEILAHYGLIETAQFTKKKTKESKVNNFYLVENALRQIKVKFDGKMIHQIMEEERGVALRLLYQIKLSCQRLSKEEITQDPDQFSMTNLKNGTIYKVIDKKQKEVLELSSSIKPPTVGGKDIRSNKQKALDNRTIAFEVNQKKLFDSALDAQQAELTLIKSIAQEQRNLNQTKLFENQTFMKEWMAEGKEKWNLNQERRDLAIQRVKYFEDREINIYKGKLNAELNAATNEMSYGVSDFEKNLQKLGIQQNISMADAVKRMEEKKGIPPGQIQNFSYAATMNKIKETKKNSDFAGKDRDRRRRKMMVDQINVQTKLDAQSEEERLIAKLLAQTSKEQEESYIEERTALCKERDFTARHGKALQLENELKAKNDQSEAQRQLTLKDVEAERKNQNELRRQELKKQQLSEKLKTRSLNIEIASGLVDLVLDLADEAFETAAQDPDHQIPKAEWRHFLDIFKEGKKVSLRNVTQKPAKAQNNKNESGFMIGKDTQAHDIIKLFSKEKSLITLYDYLAGVSQFDIGRLREDLWSQFEQLYKSSEEQAVNSKFMDTKLQRNPELQNLIQGLYSLNRGNESPDLEIQMMQANTGLNFKLSLTGGAFSGKKTVAKQLQEILGPDVVVFNINDVIKEAIDYINPKKVDEVIVDPKAKGKKSVEATFVDIFDGKNVQKYKQTAQAIKEQFLAGEQLPRKVDLADLVLDDSLLTTLFIERMKLQFEGKTLMKGNGEIRAGLAREQEIIKQLEDLEQLAIQAAADPKSKGAKPAKGGPDPEKLQQELDDIRRFKAIGWILVDYPKTQNQIKLLEQELSGFVAKVDQQKSEKTEIQETWQKLILDEEEPPMELRPIQVKPSGLDAILFLNTDLSECTRRSVGRKIDPGTQIVYAQGELPTDAKTVEKLQEFNDEAGDQRRIKQSNEQYNRRIVSIRKWTEQFGLVNEDGHCEVTLGQDVQSSNWQSKESVKEAVMMNLKQILAYKQQGFDQKRMMVKSSSLSQNDFTQEETKGLINQASKTDDLSKEEKQSTHHSQFFSKALLSEKGEVKKMSETVGGGTSSLGGTTNKSAARRKNQQRYEINDTQKVNSWEDMLNSYFRDNLQSFNYLSKQRRIILDLYIETESRFIDFICRETPYQKKVNEFVDSLNRFSEEYPDLRSNPETKVELLKRVTMLSNQLWEQILERKNQAVAERESLTQEMLQGWSSHEIAKLISCVVSLMQNEFERFRTVVAVSTGWVWNEEVDLVSLCTRLDERAVSTFQKSSNGEPTSPMLEQLIKYLQQSIGQLLQEQFVIQADQNTNEIIQLERINFNMRCNTLRVYALTLLEEINSQTEHVSIAFQGWIILSVKKENTVCQDIVNQIKRQIEQDIGYMPPQSVENPKLDRIIERVDMKGAISSQMGSQSEMSSYSPANRRIDLKTLRILFSQFVNNANESLLETQTFVTLMIRCYQNLRMPKVFKTKSFKLVLDLAEKFLTKPLGNEAESQANLFASSSEIGGVNSIHFVNWKKTQLFLTLYSSALPSEEQIQHLEQTLSKFGSQVSQKDFIQTEMWFDENESASFEKRVVYEINSDNDESTIDYGRLQDVKELLWLTIKRTNENNVQAADFIDMLRALSALAGDSPQSDLTFGDILDN